MKNISMTDAVRNFLNMRLDKMVTKEEILDLAKSLCKETGENILDYLKEEEIFNIRVIEIKLHDTSNVYAIQEETTGAFFSICLSMSGYWDLNKGIFFSNKDEALDHFNKFNLCSTQSVGAYDGLLEIFKQQQKNHIQEQQRRDNYASKFF